MNTIHIKIYIFLSEWNTHLGCIGFQLELYIGEPIEVSNYNTILQTLVTLDYAIEPKLYDTNYPLAHTSRHSLLKLARHLKLLLNLPLVFGSYCILFIIIKCIYSFY